MDLITLAKESIGKKAKHIASGSQVEVIGLHIDRNFSLQYQIENVDSTGAIQQPWVSALQIEITPTT